MKQETKFSYQQPVSKVVKIKARQVLCQSGIGGGIKDMGIDEEETI